MEDFAQIGTPSQLETRLPTGCRVRETVTRRLRALRVWAGAFGIAIAFADAAGCSSSNASSGDVGVVIDAHAGRGAGAAAAAGAVAGAVADANASGTAGAAVVANPNPATRAAPACYTPLQPEIEPAQLTAAGVKGCACETYQAGPDGIGRAYCLDGRAVWCPREKGTWVVGNDGPCSPLGGMRPEEVCTELLGGGIVDRSASCPSGFASEGGFQSAANEQVNCCYPIRVSDRDCMQAGLEVLDGTSTDNVLQTACSSGQRVRGFVGESGTKVCCERD